MSGYREHSFDPNGVDNRPPLRPFNATQWIGLAILVFGALSIAVSLLGRVGAIPDILHDDLPLVALMPLGAVLMNARRQTAPCNPEVLRRRRMIVVILALVIAVAAAVLAFLLAKGSGH
jgi:hypothetical protein